MDILERIIELRHAGGRFAIATVVSRKAPVSSQLGDKAIVLENGTMEGFVGGACSREIVRKQALEVLSLERPRLVRISPEPVEVAPDAGHDEICVPMTCASEGAVDVYIEPQIEKKQMVIAGASPIAVALVQQGILQKYDVTLVCEADEQEMVQFGLQGLSAQLVDLNGLEAWLKELPAARKGAMEVVVASMGHYDEEALAALAKAGPRYLGLGLESKAGAECYGASKRHGLVRS